VVPVVVVATLAILALAAAPAPSTGAHPPVPLCGGCTGGFEYAAADRDVNATVTYSELDLEFHRNGSATGDARLRVDERAADRFRENASLLNAVARDAFVSPERSEHSRWADAAVVRDVERVGATINDRTVRVTFALPDASTEGVGGVVFTDLFKRNATAGGIELHVNRTTLVGPANASVVRSPDGWDGDPIVLDRGDRSQFVGYGGYVAWASTNGVTGAAVADVAAFASIWSDEAATEIPAATSVAWLASVLAFAVALLLAVGGKRVDQALDPATDARWLAAGYGAATVGCIAAAVVGVVWLDADWLGFAVLGAAPGAAVAAGGTAVLATVDSKPQSVLKSVDSKPQSVLGSVPTGVCYALPVLSALAVATAVVAPGTVAVLVAATSVVLFGALGVASTRGAAPTVAVAAGMAFAPLAFAFPALSASAFGSPSPIAWVVVVAALGIPLFVLGRRGGSAASERSEHPPETRSEHPPETRNQR